MKLYTTSGAVNPARVQFLVAEKGLDIERVPVNLMQGQHKTPEFRTMAMNGLVPVLELDDGSRICESVVIGCYLESLHPEPNLFGVDAREQAEIGMWDRIVELQVMMPFAMAFRHGHPAMAALEDQVKEYGEKQKVVGQKRLKVLEKQLAGQEYIAAGRFTNVDISLWCAIRFFWKSGAEAIQEYPTLAAWYQRISDRPAAATAYK